MEAKLDVVFGSNRGVEANTNKMEDWEEELFTTARLRVEISKHL